MIAFLPNIYPDELIYSVIARYHQRSGYSLLVSTIDDIYLHRTVRPSFEFVNSFTDDAINWMTKNTTFEDLIINHTMFPFYAYFFTLEKKEKAYNSLIQQEGNWTNLLSIGKGERFFRYCPLCAKEDRDKYGETFWHRIHQIQRLNVCPIHRCRLNNTEISAGRRQSPSLFNAESIVPMDEKYDVCNELESKFANYLYEVFSTPIKFANIDIGSFLHYRLNNKYVNLGSVMRNFNAIYDDFCSFYKGLDIPSKTQIQRIYGGKAKDTYHICQIAFWEEISAKELSSFDSKYIYTENEQFYLKLSEKYDINYDLIAQIGADIHRYIYEKNRVHYKSGRKDIDYLHMDERLFPQVQRLIDNIYTQKGRPIKLSINKVEKALSLPQKRINKLPQCKAYILQNMESQNEYWAREVMWAVKEIQEQNEPLNWKHIRNLTNIRRKDLISCKKYIKNKEVLQIIEDIIAGLNANN